MNAIDASKYKTQLLVFGAVVAIWGILGWLDVSNYAQGGWNTDRNNVVTEVLPGSPAEAGGLMTGDEILSLGGIAVTDSEALSQRSRPEIGDTWEFIVVRDGAEMTLNVTFGEPVAQRKFLAHAGFLVGFCFLVFTMRAYLQRQTPSTAALALAGTLFSLAFLTGPYLDGHMLRSVANAVETILVFLGVASILAFLKTHLHSGANKLVYLPGLAAGLFIAWRILATPEATSGLNTFAAFFIGAVILYYLISSLLAVYMAYSGASASERDSRGLNLMLIGALIGIVPPVVAVLTNTLAPQVVLPGQAYYFLFFVAVPITWSMAVLKDGPTSD
jgi:hypothetical protein